MNTYYITETISYTVQAESEEEAQSKFHNSETPILDFDGGVVDFVIDEN